jgi:predicted O-linked N-acetylglucosamine transferase (SPINDLY family)
MIKSRAARLAAQSAEPTLMSRAVAAFQSGDFAAAAEIARTELANSPDNPEAWEMLSLSLIRAGQLDHAIEAGRRASSLAPGSAVYHANLGAVFRAAKRADDADAEYRAAITCDPSFPAAHYNLANLHRDRDDLDAAEHGYRAAARLDPGYADAWHQLGSVLQLKSKLGEAEECFRVALQQRPESPEILTDLATCLMAGDRSEEAEALLLRATAGDVRLGRAPGNLGALYLRAGYLVRAQEQTQRAHEIDPGEHRWIGNLAVIAKDLGLWEESERLFRRALEVRPDYVSAHSNLLFCLNYHPDKTADEVFAEYRRFDEQHARPLAPKEPPRVNDATPGRRLRLGLLSPDFREHSARHFIDPLLAHRDRDRLEVTCYAEVASPDATTRRFEALADRWRSTVGLSDAAVAELIRDDGIDILMDLGGHTAASRLMVLARKPAPVQVAYLLGHGTTSGLSAADVFLADAVLVPEGSEALFSERVVRLKRIPLAYSPPAGMPEPSGSPLARKGHVTFGYFGRPERLNERVIALWSAILARLPGSRLMLNAKPFREAAFRQLTQERFARHGIGGERLDLVYTSPQPATWDAYGEVDIALDPFPHNAGTTTIEALWLGVPVLTLTDRVSVGRLGSMILTSLGMDEWIAATPEDYVDKAARFAADPALLKSLRADLRPRFRASPLADASGFARELESAFRALWAEHVSNHSRSMFQRLAADDLSGAEAEATARLVRAAPDAEAYHVLGLVAYRKGDFILAAEQLRRSLALLPDATAWSNLGAALRAIGELPEAEAAYREALRLQPGFADALVNLSNLLGDRSEWGPAEATVQRALAAGAKTPNAYLSLGNALYHQGRLVDAAGALRQALSLDPNCIDACRNLASTLAALGEGREAEKMHRRALEMRPDYAGGYSSLLFNLNYRADLSAEEIFAEYVRWDESQTASFGGPATSHRNSPDPGRRLRIGYVSPNFGEHAVATFMLPLMEAHDRERFEIFCYAEVRNPDAATVRARGIADHWISTVGLSDDALAERVRTDGIDILVDLAGHSAGNRLPVFARKPAPVQFSHVVGHGYTTGLAAIDGLIADAAMLPQGSEHLFSEQPVRLPRSPFGYEPSPAMPEVGPLPALRNGFVTFGYFGRSVRLNERVIAAWSEILRKAPNSRLVLNNSPFGDQAVREIFAARFAAHGIAPDRLQMVFTAPQARTWEAYNDVDIALDPFPHNAGTTTFEALWMGVPVLSLSGRPSVGRFGASILGSLDLGEWVAESEQDYVTKAVATAADLDALSGLRASLRGRFDRSELCDAKGLARAMEAAYRQYWHRWCRGQARPQTTQLLSAIEAFRQGDHIRAWILSDALLRVDPENAEARHLRGLSAYRQGRASDAVEDLLEAVRREPDRAEWRWNATVMLRAAGRLGEAKEQGRAAIGLAPSSAVAHNNLGSVLKDLGEFTEAESAYRTATALQPSYADAWSNLAWLLGSAGRAGDAEDAARRALTLDPSDANALNNLGSAVLLQERLDEARGCFAEALRLRPGFAVAHSNLLFCLNYLPDIGADAIAAAYREWNDRHARPLDPRAATFAREPAPERVLRVGYVSADFRHHAVSFFVEPLIAAHDRSAVEITCYADVVRPDEVTKRFRELADRWRPIVGISDAALAEMIRADEIDILVDLSGHTAGNRLLTFARRPAPIQVAHMIGSGTTTGLSAIDAFLTDERLAPPGSEACFSERLIRLPRIPIAYAPPAGMPDVTPLPARAKGHVTFGCFSRLMRINDGVIETWSEILRRLPDACLMLNSKPFQEQRTRETFVARFGRHGIEPERVACLFTTPQPATWRAYGGIDIALDPFPHNAGTTTIEALWMGVPVVSLADRPPVGRFGAAILGALEMDDWCTADRDRYVDRAIAAASDIEALEALRASLRERFRSSPLADGAGLARAVEEAFRSLWRQRLATLTSTAEAA